MTTSSGTEGSSPTTCSANARDKSISFPERTARIANLTNRNVSRGTSQNAQGLHTEERACASAHASLGCNIIFLGSYAKHSRLTRDLRNSLYMRIEDINIWGQCLCILRSRNLSYTGRIRPKISFPQHT